MKNKYHTLTSRQHFFLAGLIVLEFFFSAWLYMTLKAREEQVNRSIFESQAKEIIASIRREVSLDLEKIVSLEALYDVAYPISRDGFRTFTTNLIHSNASIQALSWVPRISRTEKERFEAETRKLGLENFNICEKVGDALVPASPRPEYYPVYYIEPLAGNETAVGFDLASNPTRRRALQKAEATNRMVLTEPINLVQADASAKGVLAVQPFKRNGELLGYFTGVFTASALIAKSAGSMTAKGFNMNVHDPAAAENNQLLARISSAVQARAAAPGIPAHREKPYRQGIKVADREWLLELFPNENYTYVESNAHWLVLLLCTAISLGLCYYCISHFHSENILLNVFPVEIARELKESGRTQPRDFEMVSILFTDFTDFTETSSKLSANELLAEINACFSAFDAIMESRGLEKIKTIGDAYMAVGGLPVPTRESVKNTVLAALEMQEFIGRRIISNHAAGIPFFKMRAGIHTGAVAAGIVGIRRIQYDIWGDAVNTASRMESRGRVGQVNISPTTYELLKNDPDFHFQYRGKVGAKGKGRVDMWFVHRSAGCSGGHGKTQDASRSGVPLAREKAGRTEWEGVEDGG